MDQCVRMGDGMDKNEVTFQSNWQGSPKLMMRFKGPCHRPEFEYLLAIHAVSTSKSRFSLSNHFSN